MPTLYIEVLKSKLHQARAPTQHRIPGPPLNQPRAMDAVASAATRNPRPHVENGGASRLCDRAAIRSHLAQRRGGHIGRATESLMTLRNRCAEAPCPPRGAVLGQTTILKGADPTALLWLTIRRNGRACATRITSRHRRGFAGGPYNYSKRTQSQLFTSLNSHLMRRLFSAALRQVTRLAAIHVTACAGHHPAASPNLALATRQLSDAFRPIVMRRDRSLARSSCAARGAARQSIQVCSRGT